MAELGDAVAVETLPEGSVGVATEEAAAGRNSRNSRSGNGGGRNRSRGSSKHGRNRFLSMAKIWKRGSGPEVSCGDGRGVGMC